MKRCVAPRCGENRRKARQRQRAAVISPPGATASTACARNAAAPEKKSFHEEYLYKHLMDNAFKSNFSDDDIQNRIQLSNITYPAEITKKTVGQKGLQQHFTKHTSKVLQYSYKQDTVKKYGYFLDEDNLKKYSCKMDTLLRTVRSSDGIVLIYSRYLSSGIIPLCIALEHMGFYKYNNKSILKQDKKRKQIGSYIAVTGNKSLSPNNNEEIRIAKSDDNKNGELIKIILISSTGSEGIDLKNVREIHVLEPWYNMNKLDQIYGRGARHIRPEWPSRRSIVSTMRHLIELSKTPASEPERAYF